jgi:uncharacterized protein (TIGR02145 family)
MKTIYYFLVVIFLLITLNSFGQNNRINGDLRYDNTDLTVLPGVPVHLKTLLGNIVASDTTDSSGFYEISGFVNGSYILDADLNYSWGGVNSADALLVSRVFNALITMSSFRLRAGDVNSNNSTNGSDALLISRRLTGLINVFSSGNFITSMPSIVAAGIPMTVDLRVLCLGDVNGNYTPQYNDPVMVLDTLVVSNSTISASVNFSNNGSGVFERGICWNIAPSPTVLNNKLVVGSGSFGYTQVLSRNLFGNQIQFVRAYARTLSGTFYSNEMPYIPISGLPCSGISTVTDIDGNTYQGIQIGSQCWTQTNLRVSRYKNGDQIQTDLSNFAWENAFYGAYSYFNNDTASHRLFGKLYNQFAVKDFRGLCPTGWHVPSTTDWSILSNYLGSSGINGGAMKSTITLPSPGGWASPNTGATNSTGFSGLPGGYRGPSGTFGGSSLGYWWSSDALGPYGFCRNLTSSSATLFVPNNILQAWGLSVRCVRDTLTNISNNYPPTVLTSQASAVTSNGATLGGMVSYDGGSLVTARGIVYDISSNPTLDDNFTNDGNGTGIFTSTLTGLSPMTNYFARAYATNSAGTRYGTEVNFTTSAAVLGQPCSGIPIVVDIEGNVYNTVQIGSQCWMSRNLATGRYKNGDTISTGLNNSVWEATTVGAYSVYNESSLNDSLYGKLYNNYAVRDSRGICPTGWHVPSAIEWSSLVDQLGGTSVAGGALKSSLNNPALGGWISPNLGASNFSGFTALPGGLRSFDGAFSEANKFGVWWTSGNTSNYTCFSMNFAFGGVTNVSGNSTNRSTRRANGYSVRCLRDISTVVTNPTSSVSSTGANSGGNVLSDGGVSVTARGVAYGTTQNPTTANSTTNNGSGTGVFTSTLSGLMASTLYNVRAYATNSVGTAYGNQVSFTTLAPPFTCGTSTVVDIDNNTYNTVQIGTQCWTQSNLKVNKYRNGDTIPTGLSNSAWGNTTSGAYAIYNNDPVNDGLYGKLYNHYAVTDSRGLCPTGWHVPSDAEWNSLVKYLDPNADTVCIGCSQSPIVGGALKSTLMQPTPGGWNPPNTGATNSFGFTAPPGGLRDYSDGDFYDMTIRGYWWSSSVSSASNAWYRTLNYNFSNFFRFYGYRTNGFSVRCCRD